MTLALLRDMFFWCTVCGCDGQTYRNRCLLARARMSAAHGGACQ